jgi:hypothetical protein
VCLSPIQENLSGGARIVYLEGQDGLIRGEGPEVAPDEGVTGQPPLRLGRRRRLLHRGRRRHGPEKYPIRLTPPVAGKVGHGRRRVSGAEPGGPIHQRNEAAPPSRELWPVGVAKGRSSECEAVTRTPKPAAVTFYSRACLEILFFQNRIFTV